MCGYFHRCALSLVLVMLLAPRSQAQGDPSSQYPCGFMTNGIPAGAKREVMQYSIQQGRGGIVLSLEGKITSGESQRLERAIREAMSRGPISEVWLNSPGGDADEGMDMGRVLRHYGLATRIPSGNMCGSACSYAFLGGPFRAVERGADYGVHMFHAPAGAGDVLKGVVKDFKIKKNLENTEGTVMVIEQESAKFAADFMEYLSEMGISTKTGLHNFATAHKGGSCPPASVLQQWNVVNSD